MNQKEYEEIKEMAEKLMDLFNNIKNAIRAADKSLYEQWESSGFDVSDEFVSQYPSLSDVLQRLEFKVCEME